MRIVAEGLRFPEGPIAMADGSVLVVEIERGTLIRVALDGAISVISHVGGGPNGAALGPDGNVYICNNGGFSWHEIEGALFPSGTPADYRGGSIQRVDLATGAVETLYDNCNGEPLKGPNDIVFDCEGGFWFTDFGKRYPRTMDVGGVYYARCDGGFIAERLFPLLHPNGIGLSPDGSKLYVAQTTTGRMLHYDVLAPGELRKPSGLLDQSAFLYGPGGTDIYDSLAVEANGNICVATCLNGAITVISPEGQLVERVPMPDPVTTNIAFGGIDMRTAFVTLSSSGRLAAMEWKRPGLVLNQSV